MHGGANGTGRPLLHGRYSRVVKPGVRAKLEEFMADPDRDSLGEELALARALYASYLERSGGGDDDNNRAWLATVATIGDRNSRVRSRQAFDAREVVALKLSIIAILRDILDDEAAREFRRRFAELWGLDHVEAEDAIIKHRPEMWSGMLP